MRARGDDYEIVASPIRLRALPEAYATLFLAESVLRAIYSSFSLAFVVAWSSTLLTAPATAFALSSSPSFVSP
jgi:ABC-type spermidine/putrescine transport system permease subunit I